MIASICPFCRTSFRQGEPEVPQVIMDAVSPRSGYDRFKEPIAERAPIVATFRLKDLIRFVVYTLVIWIISVVILVIIFPPGWVDFLMYWYLLASALVVFFYGEKIENFLD